jgi:hypothetical protein
MQIRISFDSGLAVGLGHGTIVRHDVFGRFSATLSIEDGEATRPNGKLGK